MSSLVVNIFLILVESDGGHASFARPILLSIVEGKQFWLVVGFPLNLNLGSLAIELQTDVGILIFFILVHKVG